MIFINDYYIGGVNEIQTLVDEDLLIDIVKKVYLTNCLICHCIKSDEEIHRCLYCLKEFSFFSKSPIMKNIWFNRNLDEEEEEN